MPVEKVGEKFRCSICGNEVAVTKVGKLTREVGGALVCCGVGMMKIKESGSQAEGTASSELDTRRRH